MSIKIKVLVFMLAVSSCWLNLPAAELAGKVVRVSDGDTITVLDATNGQHKIRLCRIDAPEKKQAYGEVSRKHLAGYVAGKEVKVVWEKKDRYGRILGEVFVGEINANFKMVEEGFAWHYKHFDKTPSFATAESTAREKKLGLWGGPNPVPPWEFRQFKR